MQTGDSSDSRKRSAAEALASDVVQLPPAFLCDFVIHYRGTAFHVHKLVLFYHSSYFRGYLEPLIDGQRAYSSDECNDHPSIPHCIRLPDSCGKAEADSDDFRLFLCHLYFAQHYSCLPYKVWSHVDLDAQPPPAVTLNYPEFHDWDGLEDATSVHPTTFIPDNLYDSVMSLCHYFHCSVVLSRAEENMLLAVKVEHFPETPDGLEWEQLWACLLFALRFDLKRVMLACAPRLAKRCKLGENHKADWETMRLLLDRNSAFEMMQAVMNADVPQQGA